MNTRTKTINTLKTDLDYLKQQSVKPDLQDFIEYLISCVEDNEPLEAIKERMIGNFDYCIDNDDFESARQCVNHTEYLLDLLGYPDNSYLDKVRKIIDILESMHKL